MAGIEKVAGECACGALVSDVVIFYVKCTLPSPEICSPDVVDNQLQYPVSTPSATMSLRSTSSRSVCCFASPIPGSRFARILNELRNQLRLSLLKVRSRTRS
jgi:hypothetical protein